MNIICCYLINFYSALLRIFADRDSKIRLL
jgi:hypothetical protein